MLFKFSTPSGRIPLTLKPWSSEEHLLEDLWPHKTCTITHKYLLPQPFSVRPPDELDCQLSTVLHSLVCLQAAGTSGMGQSRYDLYLSNAMSSATKSAIVAAPS